jgi:5-(carboxyamino)imidazole ribonucleotide synthase
VREDAARLGILGAGQLGRMLALAGFPLGLRFRHLDPKPAAPSGPLDQQVEAGYEDLDALDGFAEGLEAVTYEFENVPVGSARYLEERLPVYPPPRSLEVAQDRLTEKEFFRSLDIGTAPYRRVDDRDDLEAALEDPGLPAVLKTRHGGYDGKGQEMIRGPADVEPAWERLGGQPLILEGLVDFRRELSILSVRGRDGSVAFYPPVENHHRLGILWRSLAPAPELEEETRREAERIGRAVLQELEYVGVLAVELFQVGGELLANEMAPRVHNSGHWSIEGAETSQFENHVRAVAGLPLGSTETVGCSAMINVLGRIPDLAPILRVRDAHLHLYDKASRLRRKLGHVTVWAPVALYTHP